MGHPVVEVLAMGEGQGGQKIHLEAVPEPVRGWRRDIEDDYTGQTHYLQVQSRFLRSLLLPPLTVAYLHNESVTKVVQYALYVY